MVTDYEYPERLLTFMQNKQIVKDAIAFAEFYHRQDKRKYHDLPYIIHPIEVADKVLRWGGDLDSVLGAILHDVIEDTKADYAIVSRNFGKSVADIVNWQTEISKLEDGPRRTRKRIDNEHFAKGCYRSKLGKFADIDHNCSDIHKQDPGFAKVYFTEKWELIHMLYEHKLRKPFYTTRGTILKGAKHINLELPEIEIQETA